MIFKIWNEISCEYLDVCFYELFECQVVEMFDVCVVVYEQ